MRATLEAIYENGSLHLLDRVDLRDKQHVLVTVQTKEDGPDASSSKPWMRFVGVLSKEDANEMLRAVEEACEGKLGLR